MGEVTIKFLDAKGAQIGAALARVPTLGSILVPDV